MKKLYDMFTRYQAASPLKVDFFVKQIDDLQSEVDEYFEGTPMPSVDAPAMEADVQDDKAPRAVGGRGI